MGKAGRQTERGKRGGKDNLNLLRGITRDVRDEDNLVARVLKVRLEKEAGGLKQEVSGFLASVRSA